MVEEAEHYRREVYIMTDRESRAVKVTPADDKALHIVRLTDEAIAVTLANVRQAEVLVTRVLEKGIDYGRTPGTPQDGLWDPGASKLINAFNCYPEYKLLHKVEEDNLISTTFEVYLISRDTGLIVGGGIGSCSTRETKYKYRWVADPKNYGYTEEQVATLKTKVNGETTRYRIANPEHGELVNTIDKMAAKRGDVDAAESLPGVKGALRKLFGGKAPPPVKKEKVTDWNIFWATARNLGLKNDAVHNLLGVNTMKDWLDTGRTLDDAIRTLAEKLAERDASVKEE